MPCLHCELPNLLEASLPPDPELVGLIEQAFIEGQIDSKIADLAHMILMSEMRSFQAAAMDESH